MVISLPRGLAIFFRWFFAIILIEVLTYAFLVNLEKFEWPISNIHMILAWQLIVVMIIWLCGLATNLSKNVTLVHAAELATSQKKFAHLFERSPVPYVTLDRNGQITLINLAALRFFGATEEQLIKQNFLDRIIAEENHQAVILGRFESGQVINDEEVIIKNLSGSERWVRLSIFVYGSKNERLVSLIDITDQKRMDTAKSEFVALASHQLRTPIAAARWNVELLRGYATNYDEKQLTYLEKIERNVIKMVNLIDDFLSVSKLETGTFATEVIDINLSSYFDSIIDEFQQEIVKKKLNVERDYGSNDLTIKADQRLFHISVSNLVSNAVKYCREGGTLYMAFKIEGSQVVITIADSGIGVPVNELPNLFNKFFRATNARLHKTEGTGLGLYIVKQSVELMGGTISVDSEENVGTEFMIRLKLT
jgi:PAS domain S-box-containing protein